MRTLQQRFSPELSDEEQMAQAIAMSLNEEITTETSNGAVAVPLNAPTTCTPAASAEQTPKPSIDFASAASSASVSTSISAAATSMNAKAVTAGALSAQKPVDDPNSTEKPPAVAARLLPANQNEQNSGSSNMKPK